MIWSKREGEWGGVALPRTESFVKYRTADTHAILGNASLLGYRDIDLPGSILSAIHDMVLMKDPNRNISK